MNGLTSQPTSRDIVARVTLGLSMIDSRKAGIIRDRYWRERTWPAIAKERRCSVTTAVKRFKQGMDDLRQAIMLVEGRTIMNRAFPEHHSRRMLLLSTSGELIDCTDASVYDKRDECALSERWFSMIVVQDGGRE